MAEEQQDLNEFKRWDSVGATGFLAIVPAVIYWVFVEHDVVKVAAIGGIAVLAVAVVLVLTFVFSERTIGLIINKIGVILAPAYFVIAVWLFCLKWCK